MSDRLLKDWLDNYLLFTDNSEPPETYRLWTGISVISSALQRKCKIQMGLRETFPNLYVVLVGPPGFGKGVAMTQGYLFLDQLKQQFPDRIEIASTNVTREALIKRLMHSKQSVINPNDPQDLFEHCSMTVYSPELTVFIGYRDIKFLTVLVDWFDCGKGAKGKWEYETIKRNVEIVNGVWINILGGTTPRLIQASLPEESVGSGFTSRVIFIYEETEGKAVPIPTLSEEEMLLKEKLHSDLEQILELHGTFTLSENFLKEWDKWYRSDKKNPRFKELKFAGYNRRRQHHILKLLMICNASRTNEMVIEKCDLERALVLLQQAEVKMVQTFNASGKYEHADTLNAIKNMIAIRKQVLRSEIVDTFCREAEIKVIDGIIETLHIMKHITVHQHGSDVLIKKVS